MHWAPPTIALTCTAFSKSVIGFQYEIARLRSYTPSGCEIIKMEVEYRAMKALMELRPSIGLHGSRTVRTRREDIRHCFACLWQFRTADARGCLQEIVLVIET